MKHLLVHLALPGILLLAIGLAFRQNLVTAQTGATSIFLPLVSSGPRQLFQLSSTAGRSSGGNSYQDSVPDNVRLSEVWFSTGTFIDGVQFWYLQPDGMLYTSGPHGSWGGSLYRLVFDADEYIVALNGKSALYMDSLSVVTNKRTFGPYGGSGGDTSFSISAPTGYEIAGLFGRAGGVLDYTGAMARSRSTIPFPTVVPTGTVRPVQRLTPTAGWGSGGLPYEDTVPDDGRVAELWVRSVAMIESLQFWYLRSDGTLYSPGQRGFSSRGDVHKLVFDTDEYITALNFRAGEFTDALSVVTNKRTFGPWGGPGGDVAEIVAPMGYEICGIFGKYSLGINLTGGLARQRR